MYRCTAGSAVLRLSDGLSIPADPDNRDWAEYQVWLAEGGVPEPFAAPALTEDDYQRAIEAHVEATARARRYSSGANCASYVTSAVPAWGAEAAAFVAWRDQVYVTAFATLASVQAGTEPTPSVEAFVASLPAMVWPA